MRASELINLTWQDIDFKQKCIYVEKTKNNESRTLPMHPEVENALTDYRKESNGEKVFKYKNKDSLGNTFRKVMKRLGIKDLCFHSLRHTFGTNLGMNGVDIKTIQELIGHKSIIMTMRYSHPTPEHKKTAINSLNPYKEELSNHVENEIIK